MNALKHKFFFVFFFIFLMISYHSTAQEICNNGIDDDSDGLVDLYDPECQCHFNVTNNLLLNGSFESYDHCPVIYTYEADNKIANYWEYGTYTNVNEATFYHNLSCPYDSSHVMLYMPPAMPLPDGNAFIAIQNSTFIDPTPEHSMPKSYVGQCLQNPLLKGENYTLSFYAGRFKSWDNFTGKLYPFTVAVFGNADCNAVPFGKAYAMGNGCPSNYSGWTFLGSTTIFTDGHWVQSKINFTAPFNINVIEIGPDCSILPPVIDLTDRTTFLDYHQFYLDDLHLLLTKDFPFQYIKTKTGIVCNGLPVLQAPVVANATYQWYKDSIAIKNATSDTYEVADTTGVKYYNVLISSNGRCIITEPFLVTASNLNKINMPADTVICKDTLTLAPALEGIAYTVNGQTSVSVVINKEGYYDITATDKYGCEKKFTTHVLKQNCGDCILYVPTAFTPNNDGLNDLFKPKLNCIFSDFYFAIFNRWGQKIFESKDINKGWDGKYKGVNLPPGSYAYYIRYKTASGIIKTQKGLVVLII